MIRKPVAVVVVLHLLASPVSVFGAPTIPGFHGPVSLPTPPAVNTLPSPRGNAWTGVRNITTDTSTNRMVINQTQPRATIDWNSFDIGANASVHFNQKNKEGVAQKDWAALNRIYDRNPSQIYGSLTADGKVYLINQNGILFGPGSRVSVPTLFASTLNIRDKDFTNDTLRFTAENYQDENYRSLSDSLTDAAYAAAVSANLTLPLPSGYASVTNYGEITTSAGGAVYLMGPLVENVGVISTPSGVTALVALLPTLRTNPNGSEYDLQVNDLRDTDVMTSKQSTVTLTSGVTGGEAVNYESGTITADSGLAAMYGGLVTQRGVIRSVTAVKKGGRIELLATDRITTGAASSTATPVSDSTETANETFGKKSGAIILSGLNRGTDESAAVIDHEGSIEAPSGTVYLEASQRIYLGAASAIDVSGLWVDEPADAAIVTQQLNSVNLRDNYAQKEGTLQGETITVNPLTGSAIGDISGNYGVQELTAREKSTTGGKIFLGSNMLTNISKVNDSTTREIVVGDGAMLSFAGGGFNYAEGGVSITKLVSGTKVYDISSASSWMRYDSILGNQETTYGRYGLSETFSGIYFGGGAPVLDRSGAYSTGSDAGAVSVEARQVILNGVLDGSVTRGVYQTLSDELRDQFGNQKTSGRMEPLGGTLSIGSAARVTEAEGRSDAVVDELELVSSTAALPSWFGPDSELPGELGSKTVVGADTLNAAGLSSISLNANKTFTMAPDAALSLASVSRKQSDGSVTNATVSIKARSIDFAGSIDAPGGSVTLAVGNNFTSNLEDNPDYLPMAERIFLESGSRISVAGDRIDNTTAGESGLGFGHAAGGKITLNAYSLESDGLFIKAGALLDVSGGYTISEKGVVTGGDAGTLSLAGPNIVLDAEVRGLALQGNKGGKISFTTENVLVSDWEVHLSRDFRFDTEPADILRQGLVLGADSLAESGFSRIELKSFNDAALDPAVTLKPSMAVMEAPVPGDRAASESGIVLVTPDLISGSSITLVAGAGRGSSTTTLDVIAQFSEKTDLFPGGTAPTNLAAQVTIPSNSLIETAPGGTITLTGPAIQILGDLTAKSGSIAVSVSTDPTDTYTYDKNPLSGTLFVGEFARLDASGYNKPIYSAVDGLPAGFTPLDGGTITLSATTTDNSNPTSGTVEVALGATLDVSGSTQVTRTYRGADGTPETVTFSGNPGAIDIVYQNDLFLDGKMDAAGYTDGLRGGSLSIARENQSADLELASVDVKRYLDQGFDSMTFRSLRAISISGDQTIAVPRSLTLDAPILAGRSNDEMSISSTWLTLTNTFYPVDSPASDASATLTLSGTFVDVEGDVKLSGFSGVMVEAAQDIRLTDRYYLGPNNAQKPQAGRLESSGDIILKAARIYPTSQSKFTVESTGGTITTLPNGTASSAVYSAFGNLTLTAAGGIDHEGFLAAPLGALTLTSDGGRVLLAEGSVATTAGNTVVNVGSLDGDLIWRRQDRSYSGVSGTSELTDNNSVTVTGIPEQSITLNGNEVIVAPGSLVDVSGGGSIFGYSFISDLTGTVNPISIVGVNPRNGVTTRTERFVILPDNSVQVPGFTYTDASGKERLAGAVHLAGVTLGDGTVLKEGTYSLLPEAYAFVPGALIVSSTGTIMSSTDSYLSKEGYAVVAGYGTNLGTSVQPATYTGYTVRSASDVLTEGHFEIRQLSAATGGSLTVTGATSILAGDIRLSGLGGANGGRFSMTADTIEVSSRGNDDEFLADFYFDSPLPQAYVGTGLIDPETLSNKGIQELSLTATNLEKSGSITIGGESSLTIPTITLTADSSISLLNGAVLNATGENSGSLTMTTSSGGSILVESNALVRAYDTMTLDTGKIDIQGDLRVDNGGLSLIGNRIVVVGDTSLVDAEGSSGLCLSPSLLEKIGLIRDLSLISRSDMFFAGDVTLAAQNTLTIDTTRIGGDGSVSVTAGKIVLENSGRAADTGASPAPSAPIAGTAITFTADETTINVGNSDDTTLRYANQTKPSLWNLNFDGFETVSFTTADDLTLRGVGAVRSAGNINLTAARITTTAYADAETSFKSSRVSIEALKGTVTINKGTGTAGTTSVPGGTLSISAKDIVDAGAIDLPSGRLDLTAANSITLTGDALIVARGSRTRTADTDTEVYTYGPGGKVTLAATTLDIQNGALIDVSAFENGVGDAGSISLSGPGGVMLNGTIIGMKGSGADDLGGSFALDAATVDLPALTKILSENGFDRKLSIRARQGDLFLDGSLKAGEIYLSSDSGDITVSESGVVDASGVLGGGRVELSSGHDLTISGSILAAGTGVDASGGEVLLQAGDVDAGGDAVGTLSINPGAVIDVSGRDVDGIATASGTVHIRAMRNTSNDDLLVNLGGSTLKDTVKGASRISVEGVRIYSMDSPSSTLATMLDDASGFMAVHGADVADRLFGQTVDSAYQLLPGIEVRSNGPFSLTTLTGGDLDLTTVRFGAMPGVLTLRSGGELDVNASIYDTPALVAASYDYTALRSWNLFPTWGINLVAGADLTAADITATKPAANGALTVDAGAIVYTENAPVRFASGGDTTLNQAYTGFITFWGLPASIGTFSGDVTGTVGRDLVLNSGVLQSSVGDIRLDVGRNVTLSTSGITYGAIRTTGQPDVTAEYGDPAIGFTPEIEFFNFRDGGDISIQAGGNITGGYQAASAWDYATVILGDGSADLPFISRWSANYGITIGFNDSGGQDNITQGIATMAGGDVSVSAGGDVMSQIGAFSETISGDVRVYTKGDIFGRYVVANGNGSLIAQGNVGITPSRETMTDARQTSIELLNAHEMTVTANGSIVLGSIRNPTLDAEYGIWYPTYARDGKVSLTSLAGSVSLYGASGGSSTQIFPASMEISAAQDISLRINAILSPSPDAALRLYAGGSIFSEAAISEINALVVPWKKIWMSDMDTDQFFVRSGSTPNFSAYNNSHGASPDDATVPLHAADSEAAVINARADISSLEVYLPKKAEISAGNDISSVYISTQNQTADDLTTVTAGRNVSFSTNPFEVGKPDQNNSGIEHAGPGILFVWAGKNMDLGNSPGIRSVGNSYNTALGDKGSDIIVLSGTNAGIGPGTISSLFLGEKDENGEITANGLQQYGNEYSELMSQGEKAAAEERIAEAREKLIAPLFTSSVADSGSISMVSSQISTISGADSIFIVARDTIDVGRSSLNTNVEGKGIFTAKGGGINIYTGNDLNVNESRVMTFFGGDITIWADSGDINAGRGSKTAISPPTFTQVKDFDGNITGYKVNPPAVGSGLRALTYDANTSPDGDIPIPEPGNIYAFAPQGVIDAGEAGIAGGKVVLGATEVLNARNISFSVGSVGVPASSDASVSLGALTGGSALTENNKMIEQTALGASKSLADSVADKVGQLMSGWLDVKVISFDEEEEKKE